mmetsp:Transcript_23421/g.47735  ORF Transcript_23421/g.47735 Transcript_23421/m.47735 type:complete len:270 (-) Transcript_23421:21-830(-)
MDLHDVQIIDPTTVFTRWTLAMTFKAFPWKPRLLFTGTTKYTISAESGLVTRHEDTWDSIDDNQPVSMEAVLDLIGQMAPDLAGQGVKIIKRAGVDAAPYSMLRRWSKGFEVRKYEGYTMAQTPPGEVYDRDSYNAAVSLLQDYRGDALSKAKNANGKVLPASEPLLQLDSGRRDSSLAYVIPPGQGSAPAPLDKTLSLVQVPPKSVAVLSVRGYGADRGRTEEAIESGLGELRAWVEERGFRVVEEGKAFTLASYSDGYELWLTVEEQ